MFMSSPEPAVHHHGPPQSFIRKYVFSLDHKVIGKQYYRLAHGLFCADHRAIRGLWKLLPADSSRGRRHGFPSLQYDVFLGYVCSVRGADPLVLRWRRTAAGWMDLICAAKFRGRRCRARTGNRPDPMGGIHRYLLYRSITGFAELHYYNSGLADERDVAGAHAAFDVGMVRNLGNRVARLCSFIAGLRAAASGSNGGNELFQLGRPGCE